MKTPIDMMAILFRRLKPSALSVALNGNVFLSDKPGLSMEAVVINALPVTGGNFQLGTANVNIYAPNLSYTRDNKPKQVADTLRLNELLIIAVPLLTHITQEYQHWLMSMNLMQDPDTGEHYMNCRIDFQFLPGE